MRGQSHAILLHLRTAASHDVMLNVRIDALMLCVLTAVHAVPASHAADTFPTKPLRYVVAGSVGGGADVLARTVAQKLSERWGQQVIVDNRPSGGSIVSSEIVARSQPDGHTLLMAFTSHVTNPSLYQKLPYDAVRDFAPVTMIATMSNVLVVHQSVPADSVPALIALARKKQLAVAHTGIGASNHLAGILFGYLTGAKLLSVAYKGAGPAITAVLSAETDMMFATMVSILPQVKSGRLRALAVTGARRSPATPALPTVSEAGVPGYEANAWFATYAAAGTSAPLVQQLNTEITRIINGADVRDRLASQGAEAMTSTPAELARYTADEIVRWRKVIRESGARAE